MGLLTGQTVADRIGRRIRHLRYRWQGFGAWDVLARYECAQ
jgi:hypothetical protein